MPIYEFRCLKCKNLFELLLLSNDDKLAELKCPSCKCEEFERVLSTTNFTVTNGGTMTGNSCTTSTNMDCAGGSCTTYDIPGPK